MTDIELDWCPFCGEEHELKIVRSKWARYIAEGFDAIGAQVRCGHCSATGGRFIEASYAEAAQRAVENWNEAPRGKLYIALSRFFYPIYSRLGL